MNFYTESVGETFQEFIEICLGAFEHDDPRIVRIYESHKLTIYWRFKLDVG